MGFVGNRMSYIDLGRLVKVVLDALDRLPDGILVILFGVALAGFCFAFGLLLLLVVWLVGWKLPGS
jgi:hypothetical protein